MRLRHIIPADKDVWDWGKATGGMRMPNSAFPVSRARGNFYRLGNSYTWQVVRFRALGQEFRLLIAFHLAKEQYRATLAVEAEKDLRIVASYEFHGTHPGWHVHAACGPLDQVPPGLRRGPWQRTLPKARQPHRRLVYGVTEKNALARAAKFYNLYKAPGSLF